VSLINDLIEDLDAESAALEAVVSGLTDEQWELDTPAAGWTIATQIGHLLSSDQAAILAASAPDDFAEMVRDGLTRENPWRFIDEAAIAEGQRPKTELLADWRTDRARLAQLLLEYPEGTKLPWFGPPMSAPSMASARLMETWAHGQDILDALGKTRTATDRIRAVVHLVVRSRDFGYVVRGLTPPAAPFRYEITAPSGELWTWGPEDAADIVRGDAVDLCLLATQRRNIADLNLTLLGDEARRWPEVAQCFAGQPGAGRAPQDGPAQSTSTSNSAAQEDE